MGASGVSCMLPVCISPADPGSESQAFADEVCAIPCIGSLADPVPGCDMVPAWLKRHHRTEATTASAIVANSAIQKARRYAVGSGLGIICPLSLLFVLKSCSFMAHPPR